MKIIDKIAWIFIRDGKVLSTRSRGKTTWYLPGGKREDGETDLQTLARELREELSIEILQDRAEKIGVYEAQAHGHPDGVVVRMTCYTAPYKGALKPAAEIEEMAWLTSDPEVPISPVDEIIFASLKQRGLLS